MFSDETMAKANAAKAVADEAEPLYAAWRKKNSEATELLRVAQAELRGVLDEVAVKTDVSDEDLGRITRARSLVCLRKHQFAKVEAMTFEEFSARQRWVAEYNRETGLDKLIL